MVRLTLLAPLLVALSCSTLPEPVVPLTPDPGAAFAADVQAAVEAGDPQAKEKLAALLSRHPDSVDARRLRQNLRIAAGEAWQVYEEAKAAHEAAPDDSGRLYLYARSLPDRERQAELFRRVIDLDPSLFRGWYGYAVAMLELGDPATAIEAVGAALAIRPDDLAAMVLLAAALTRSGDRERAEQTYGRVFENSVRGIYWRESVGLPAPSIAPLLAAARWAERIGRAPMALLPVLGALEVRPGSAALEGMAWSLLTAPEILEADVLRALSLCGERPTVAGRLLRSRCHFLLGDAEKALRDLNAVAGTDLAGFLDHDEWFGAAVGAGEYGQARRILAEARPRLLTGSSSNSRAVHDDRLDAALLAAGRSPGSADTLAELSRALSGCGFGQAAADCAARAQAVSPQDSALQGLLADALAWQSFLDELELTLRRLREPGTRGDASPSLDEVHASLARISRRLLDRDVVSGIPEESFPFVGAVLRSDRDGAPAEWAERGTLLVVGQRAGAPVAAFTARLAGRLGSLRDGDVAYDLVLGRGSSLSIGDGPLGAVAGFTLPGWVVLDLDVIDGSVARLRLDARSAHEVDLWPAQDEETRRSLWFPAGVRARLAARVEAPEEAVLQATLVHERGHAVDADRYVPFLPNLPRALLAFAGHGFSPRRVEIGLERTAEVWALRFSPDRRAALANTLLFLPHERSAPPHSVAYYGIIEDLIAEIDEHPGDYPSIDRRFNLVQQLDRLSDAELDRLISRALP